MGVNEFCHRCGAELPAREWAGDGGFFCPHCGAPQILLPDYLRAEVAETPRDEAGLGVNTALPPPMPKEIHWRTAIRDAALVAVVGGVLTGVGTASGFVSFLGFLWVVSGGVIAMGFYQKRKPAATMSVRVGLRVGAVTGVLMMAALAVALATAGSVARFGLHRMAEFDGQVATFQEQMKVKMREQQQSPEVTAEAMKLMESTP